jgi:hypothetical protein
MLILITIVFVALMATPFIQGFFTDWKVSTAIDYLQDNFNYIVLGSGAQVPDHLIPSKDNTYDLGSASHRWRNLYLGNTATIPSITGVTSFSASGDIDIGSHDLRAETFTSDIATGTAPFTVSSNTTVANLSADLVDGYQVARTATYVVAASDAPAHVKAQTDYVCDGVDDQVEIQAAIDALPAGGGRIVLLEGTYNCAAQISIDGKSNIELIGVGYPTLDFATSPADTFSLYFEVSGVTNGAIRGLRIINSTKSAIIGLGTKVTIEDNIIENATLQGINMQGEDIAIINNKVDGVTNEFGIVLGGKLDNVVVANNQVRNCAGNAGIQWGYSGSGVIIADNVIYNCANGISIGGIEAGGFFYTEKCLIEGNVIRTVSSNGIEILKKSDADPTHIVRDFKVIGNKIYDAGSWGLRSRDVDTIIFENNLVKGAVWGIMAESPNTNLEIINNRFYNLSTSGMSINHDDVVIRANRINTTTYDGISLPLGNTFTNVVIEGNIFEAIGRDSIRNLYSGNLPNVKRNRGYTTENSGTATFSGDGTTVSFSFAHGLAATPTHVEISPTSDDAAGDWKWSADATNVTITFMTAPASGAITGEVIGTGDGVAVTFSFTLANIPVEAGTVSITDGVETFSDNGDGTLTGSAGGSGTIDYETGAGSVTFAAAPASGASITADYNWLNIRLSWRAWV